MKNKLGNDGEPDGDIGETEIGLIIVYAPQGWQNKQGEGQDKQGINPCRVDKAFPDQPEMQEEDQYDSMITVSDR